MPFLNNQFPATLPFKNAHVNTIYKYFNSSASIPYNRKRIETWDDDFIDVDILESNSFAAVLLLHGLEGSSNSSYMTSTANYLKNFGYDVICINLRGCSGVDNNSLKTYHAGKTDDLAFIIDYLNTNYSYQSITLCGFSLGGNIILKYLGEFAGAIPKCITGGIAISVPIDLESSQMEMNKLKNRIYMKQFLRTLKSKIVMKAEKFPEYNPDKKQIAKASTFRDLEEIYTAPVFGFKGPEEYWLKASSKPYLYEIKHKTLLINAKDDSFLSLDCYPYEIAKNSSHFYLMTPDYGGHVGFVSSFKDQVFWLENQIVNFIQEKLQVYP